MRNSRVMIISLICGILAAGLLAAPQAQADIYGLKSQAGITPLVSMNPTNFYTFKENGSSFTDYGAIKRSSTQIDADALAYSPTSGLFAYELIHGSSSITGSYLVSLTNGGVNNVTATRIGSELTGYEIRGATFVGSQLWVLDAKSSKLLNINPTTGAVIATKSLSQTIGNSCDLAMRSDGTVYLEDFQTGGDRIYTVNLSSGALTLVHTDTNADNQYTGNAFSLSAPSDRMFVYEVGSKEDIYYLDINSSWARTKLYSDIIPGFNAGRGDLASYVPLPSTALLMVSGLLGLVGLRRKMKR